MSEVKIDSVESSIEKNESIENKDSNIEEPKEEVLPFEELEKIEILFEQYQYELRDLGYKDWDKLSLKDFLKITKEEYLAIQKEFGSKSKKNKLREEWAKINNEPWPKGETRNYDKNGSLIKIQSRNYDMHHVIPKCLGGKNIASNIVPLSIDKHEFIHRPDGPLKQLIALMKGF